MAQEGGSTANVLLCLADLLSSCRAVTADLADSAGTMALQLAESWKKLRTPETPQEFSSPPAKRMKSCPGSLSSFSSTVCPSEHPGCRSPADTLLDTESDDGWSDEVCHTAESEGHSSPAENNEHHAAESCCQSHPAVTESELSETPWRLSHQYPDVRKFRGVPDMIRGQTWAEWAITLTPEDAFPHNRYVEVPSIPTAGKVQRRFVALAEAALDHFAAKFQASVHAIAAPKSGQRLDQTHYVKNCTKAVRCAIRRDIQCFKDKLRCELDILSAQYAGELLCAKQLVEAEVKRQVNHYCQTCKRRHVLISCTAAKLSQPAQASTVEGV